MLNSPDTSQSRPHALLSWSGPGRCGWRCRPSDSGVFGSTRSRDGCVVNASHPRRSWSGPSGQPQMSEPLPLAEATTIWVREMTRAFQLYFELDVQVRRSAEVIAAVQAIREQAPDLADFVLPDLFHGQPAPREAARPRPALTPGASGVGSYRAGIGQL